MREQCGHLQPFIEDSMSIDRDYFSLHFVNQRQVSPLARREKDGHPHPFVKDSIPVDRDKFSLHFETIGKEEQPHGISPMEAELQARPLFQENAP